MSVHVFGDAGRFGCPCPRRVDILAHFNLNLIKKIIIVCILFFLNVLICLKVGDTQHRSTIHIHISDVLPRLKTYQTTEISKLKFVI